MAFEVDKRVEHTLAVAVADCKLARVVVVGLLPSVPLLRSIEDRVLGPCKLWNHRGRLTFHNGCKRKLREGLDDRSIGLELEL